MNGAASASNAYVPPPAFSFRVSIEGADGDTGFQEVSGLQVEIETEDVAEGGQNRFVHKLPTRSKYANLILKRGVVTGASAFGTWVTKAMSRGLVREGGSKTIVIQLTDNSPKPLMVWKVFGAYPLRWDHGPLNSMSNEVLIETIELSYQFFSRQVG